MDFLLQLSESMRDAYSGDCLKHARAIQQHLEAEGRDAWIGRLRLTEKRGDSTFHHPLRPLRYRGRSGPTWTTHYVCCSGGEAFDPLLGVPVPLASFSMLAFGVEIAIERVAAEPDN